MNIFICAGTSSEKINQMISGKEGLNTFSYPDISQGMRELNIVTEAKSFVIFDSGFFIDGRQLDVVEVFDTLIKLANANKDTEILLITQNEDIYDNFCCGLIDCKNTRIEQVDKLSTKIIIDCILGRYKKVVAKDNANEEPVEDLTSVPVPEPKPEPKPQQKQKPKPQPKPQPKKEKPKPESKPEKPVPPPQPKKERIFRKREPLSNFLRSNKVIAITGNPNSGGRSTAFYQAYSLASGGVNTLLIDLDIYTKGLNFYIDELDSNKSSVAQKSGLLLALDAIDNYGTNVISIKSDLDFLGTSSGISWISCEEVLSLDKIKALINYVRVDYDCVVINLPIDILKRYLDLAESIDTFIYCTNPTINGIMSIDYNMNILTEMDRTWENNLLLLHKKTKYVLTNATGKTGIFLDNFLDKLFEITESSSLHRELIGEIPHMESFDKFAETKVSLLSDSKFEDIIYNITKNTII